MSTYECFFPGQFEARVEDLQKVFNNYGNAKQDAVKDVALKAAIGGAAGALAGYFGAEGKAARAGMMSAGIGIGIGIGYYGAEVLSGPEDPEAGEPVTVEEMHVELDSIWNDFNYGR